MIQHIFYIKWYLVILLALYWFMIIHRICWHKLAKRVEIVSEAAVDYTLRNA
jgi:hypothetical protein